MPGSICWVDLGTPEPAAAATFYAGLLGWSFTEPERTGYRVAMLRGLPVAGLGPATDSGDPYWTVNVSTADIHETLQAVEASGGTVLEPPTQAGDQGIGAVTRSPSGLPLSFWQPLVRHGMQLAQEPGAFQGLSLRTPEPEDEVRYLNAVLGWRAQAGGSIRSADASVAVTTTSYGPGQWMVHFAVQDRAVSMRLASDLGATTTADGDVRDPHGAVFGLDETSPPD
ncbi:VOC family protein [uncultured Friedmanniella sp.]|uniref:VOC family protein n=1 Tax=uncultured Friedmanniella sp. TaxID=335381 RepID=UPI0035CA8079